MTHAVPLELVGYNNNNQPLCPKCIGGRLHPYSVSIHLARASRGVTYTGERVDSLSGWVAICVGNRDYRRWKQKEAERYPDEDWGTDDPIEPCGFWMPMTPHRRD